MFVWPTREQVDEAVRRWAAVELRDRPNLRKIGYFGSYARGDWGVGSDLDLIAIVDAADQPFERRAIAWDTTELPVPAEIVVYTADEWARLGAAGTGFARTVNWEVVWLNP